MKIWLILLPVIAITTINCSKLNSGHGIQIKNDKPNFANKVQLDTETEITIPQFNRELSSFKNNLLTSYEGLSFSEKGLSSIGYINEASGEVYICPEDYTSVYTVVRHETSNIYYLYEESVRTLESDEHH